MIEKTYAHVVPQVTPDLSFANMGRKWGGLGRFTPIGDTDESGEVIDHAEVCLARDRVHIIPETWFTQLAFGESPNAVENV